MSDSTKPVPVLEWETERDLDNEEKFRNYKVKMASKPGTPPLEKNAYKVLLYPDDVTISFHKKNNCWKSQLWRKFVIARY